MLADLHDGVGSLATNIHMLAELGRKNEARARQSLALKNSAAAPWRNCARLSSRWMRPMRIGPRCRRKFAVLGHSWWRDRRDARLR